MKEANAKRIVACVNFCEGHPNDHLDHLESLDRLREQNYALKKWRSPKGNPHPDLLVLTKKQALDLKYLSETGKTDEVAERLFNLIFYGRITPPQEEE